MYYIHTTMGVDPFDSDTSNSFSSLFFFAGLHCACLAGMYLDGILI
uniref:Uncharacterized protein n=1 Tax=Arundo donax TaxID=35708 RepID=A0A0A9GLM0_ARUDO